MSNKEEIAKVFTFSMIDNLKEQIENGYVRTDEYHFFKSHLLNGLKDLEDIYIEESPNVITFRSKLE